MSIAFRFLRLCRVYLSFGILLLAAPTFAAAQNLVSDPGFELQTTSAVSTPWLVEGPDGHGIDLGTGFSHSGANDAWIRDSTANWNATTQWVSVATNTNYTLTGWVRNNFTTNLGYLGVRMSDGVTVLQQASFSAATNYTEIMVNFNSGSNSTVMVFAGFTGQSVDRWLQIDDISIKPTVVPAASSFFSTAKEEGYSTYQLSGDGDLWPSCWASDGNLYSANGDGTAFTSNPSRYDMAVSKITGNPPSLSGTTLATNVGTNWSGSSYNRKPTGMVCTGGAIYLAFQNLNLSTFADAPAASIAKSTDNGNTWTWDTSAPMFGTPNSPASSTAYKFTTIFFADFGKNSANAIDGYVYAYGMDNNWRSQQSLYLGRVPNNSIQTRSAWTFFTGTDGSGNPIWSSDITAKAPVLEDDRLLYPVMFGTDCPTNQPVIAQGGVVYDAPLQRYLFTSWSCATHELYEAPNPWGPWKLVTSKDFTPLRLLQSRGQYGTNIPSKFISSDGKTLWIQSNVCCSGNSYTYSLRQMYFAPFASSSPTNTVSDTTNLAAPSYAPKAISKSSHFGMVCGAGCSDSLNDANVNQSEDDYDEETKPTDWWGYTWPTTYNLNKVVYVTGNMFSDGGWFSGGLNVQVRQNFVWVNVSGLTINPSYPYSNAAGTNQTYTFTFQNTWGDGVRIIGTPGGTSHFTSVGELAAYYDTGNLVSDPGFEFQTSSTVSGAWAVEGPDNHGIDRGAGFAHSGSNNAWIHNYSTANWNATTQWVSVKPNTNYTLTGWVQNNFTTNLGYFGVRKSDGSTVLQETSFSAAPGYTQLTVTFNSGSNSTVKVYAGFWGQSVDYWLRIDDVSLHQ